MESISVKFYNDFIVKFEELKNILLLENTLGRKYTDTGVNFIKTITIPGFEKRDIISLIISLVIRFKGVSIDSQIDILNFMISYLNDQNSKFINTMTNTKVNPALFRSIEKETFLKCIGEKTNNFFGEFPKLNSIFHITSKLLEDISFIELTEETRLKDIYIQIRSFTIHFVDTSHGNMIKEDLIKFLIRPENKDLDNKTLLDKLFAVLIRTMNDKMSVIDSVMEDCKGKDQYMRNKIEEQILCQIIIPEGFVTYYL